MAGGSAHVELFEQSSVHSVIAQFAGRCMGESKLGTADRRCEEIDHDIPGLREKALKPLYKGLGYWLELLDDENLRLQGFTVYGTARVNESTNSWYNLEQVAFALKKILPYQTEFFGQQTSEKCLWLTGHGETVKQIEERFKAIQLAEKISPEHLPSVMTIDSSQGREADWVVLFSISGSNRTSKHLDIMANDYRMNVAVTRAKNIFFYIHGDFDFTWTARRSTSATVPSSGSSWDPLAVVYAHELVVNKMDECFTTEDFDQDDILKILEKQFNRSRKKRG